MNWIALDRMVATPTAATIAGTQAAGGALLTVEVSFNTIEWPWDKYDAVTLIPQSTLLRAKTKRGDLQLGIATPAPEHVVTPSRHSSTTKVQFTLQITTVSLSELETYRDGGSLEMALTLVAHPVFTSHQPNVSIRPTSVQFAFKVPVEDWLSTLRNVGFCDSLITELKLPSNGPDATTEASSRLKQAVGARNSGEYGDSLRRCRIALNELASAGFGGRAPREVAAFLKEKAGTLTPTERYSALKLALELFLSPAHHANAPEEHYSREDADLALAMTAALVKLAPQHGLLPVVTTTPNEPNAP